MSKKPIIVFEGIDCSGKSLHINHISKFLKKKKISFIKIREPGGSKNSEQIRNVLFNNKNKFHRNTDLLLYMASRSENMEIIKKNYKKKIILIDRFIDSTIAYQHYGMGINIRIIDNLNKFLLSKIKPNFTFINIVSPKNMINRLKKRKNLNRYDKFKINFYRKVQNGYLKIQKKNTKKYQVIDTNLSIEFNKKKILDKIKELIL
tara:strand:+ start:3017 stop:3631 length:615 start_codon:yes stop_codon:yes gene_type:complete